MALADAFGRLTALDFDGQPVRLGPLWAEQPTLLVWIRHYG